MMDGHQIVNNRIEIYDTTLRDGTQGEAVNFSAADKCRISVWTSSRGVGLAQTRATLRSLKKLAV
jgi:hypothetical protein